MMRGLRLLVLLAAAACQKAPLDLVDSGFLLSDATWFAEEETLFVFYEMWAEQGLTEHSVIEVSWVTDESEQPWVELHSLPMVHTHVEVDCGPYARCGSASVHVPVAPRDVRIRLRYHREGALALDAPTAFNLVGLGFPHSHRSLAVYGVFDESNRRIQWRARHQFPTLRNEEVERLGLRRAFHVEEARYGDIYIEWGSYNPYGYGTPCFGELTPTGLEPVQTSARAVFQPDLLPIEASEAPIVCAEATVLDARGRFVATAFARKNPEVKPAFPLLRSPVRDAVPLKFFLGPCEETISKEHEAMQRQRLGMEGVPTTCTDDWSRPSFVPDLVLLLRDAVETARVQGRDMVIVIGLHRTPDGVALAVEEALAAVVPQERHRNTPRLAGAFVLDSAIWGITIDELSQVTLWCPAPLPTGAEIPDASVRACAVAPDNPDFQLGPFSVGMLPILAPRSQYLRFIEDYSVKQAGRVTDLSFRVPEFATTSDHVDLGDFGVVTFLDGERIYADRDHAFSWCATEEPPFVMFRSPTLMLPIDDCEALGLPEELCVGTLPLEMLPEWHATLGEPWYELGLFWEFPFLLRMEYETYVAGALSAFSFTVPFGVASTNEAYYGTPVWLEASRSLEEELTQCVRFCDHPTFDGAGVYHPSVTFRQDYAQSCYRPRYPQVGDSGFPLDP